MMVTVTELVLDVVTWYSHVPDVVVTSEHVDVYVALTSRGTELLTKYNVPKTGAVVAGSS